MPRDLPVANGQLLVNVDQAYQIRDVFFPHIGKENHTAGHAFRWGVWVDGQFRWLHDEGWVRDLGYEPGTLVTHVALRHPALPVYLVCRDAVDFHEPLYVRRIDLHNETDQPHEVRLFFHHDFHLYETNTGDTAYYEPARDAVLHYKDERWFLINGGRLVEGPLPAPKPPPPPYWRGTAAAPRPPLQRRWTGGTEGEGDAFITHRLVAGIDQYSTGDKEVHGAEGTWRDVEGDGVLEGNPIAKGSVDSTIALHAQVPARGVATLYYWIAAGRTFEAVTLLNRMVRERGAQSFLDRTASYWRLWVDKQELGFGELAPELVDLFRRSLLVIRTQIDDGGAIIAANDYDIAAFGQDTYSYCWPRDGALVAQALDRAGYQGTTQAFFNFCARVVCKEGYFLHKYHPEGSLASSWHPWSVRGEKQLPIQEDETGLVLWALWDHFDRYRDIEFVKPLYRQLIVPAAEFLAAYRDERTGLPLPSYNLWEEVRGVHAFTVAAVWAGLVAGARFTSAFGEEAAAARYLQAAAAIKEGADRYLWRPESNRFVRMLTPRISETPASGTPAPAVLERGTGGPDTPDDDPYDVDWTLDASMYGLWRFGMYAPDDPRIAATMHGVHDRLWVRTPIGGMARYERDYYHQVSQDTDSVAGNPWFICTLWWAQWLIATAHTDIDLDAPLEVLEWVRAHALPSGVLAEQLHPYAGVPLSVSPLTWSHAEFVNTVLALLEKWTELRRCSVCGQPTYLPESGRHLHRHGLVNLAPAPAVAAGTP